MIVKYYQHEQIPANIVKESEEHECSLPVTGNVSCAYLHIFPRSDVEWLGYTQLSRAILSSLKMRLTRV